MKTPLPSLQQLAGLALLCGSVACASLSLVGCSDSRADEAQSSHAPESHAAESHAPGHRVGRLIVTRPLVKEVELLRDYVCQIHAIQRIEVRALEGGYLQDLHVDEGKRVEKGSLMFQQLPLVYQAEYEIAKAEAEVVEREYRNTKLLAEKSIVSANELALVKAKLAKAEAEVRLRAAHRGLTRIEAPFTGLIGHLEVRRGSLLEEGELLTTLSDNSKMWVYFNVAEGEYLDVKARGVDLGSLEVSLVLANGQVFDQKGVVETIEADFDNETGTIPFRATFANPAGLLRHGGTGKIRITTTLPEALVIPQKATFEILDQRYVYVVDQDNQLHQRRITVSEEIPHLFVVSGGLAEGDRVLFEGLRKVHDGLVIEAKFEEPTALLATLDVPAE